MTNEDNLEKEFRQDYEEDGPIAGEKLESEPVDLPKLLPKAGYKTSQGQLTVVFALVSFILSALGFKYSSDDVNNLYVMIQNIVTVVGPLLALIPVLITYINSRGKIQSNQLWASASLSNGGVTSSGPLPTIRSTTAELIEGQPAMARGIGGFGSILGGRNWKDPKRYLNIAKIGGSLVPGVGSVVGAIEGDSDQDEINQELFKGMSQLDENQQALDKKLDKILAHIEKK